MESTPQQVEKDVFVGSRQTPPLKLEMSSRRDGLLEDLVVLGHVPVSKVIVRDVGLVHQDRQHQLPVTNWHFSRSFHFYFSALTLVVTV